MRGRAKQPSAYAMQQIDIDFEANKTQPPPAPSKGGYPHSRQVKNVKCIISNS
jgi:hypothetical protein